LDTPYSVHRGLYGPDGNRSSTTRTEFTAICGLALFGRPASLATCVDLVVAVSELVASGAGTSVHNEMHRAGGAFVRLSD
jgi:hypothetical protein